MAGVIKPSYVVRCHECNDDLEVRSVDGDSYGTVTFEVTPCPSCIKSGEDTARDAGFDEGKKEGHDEGDSEGYDRGYEEGKAAGDKEGYERGFREGEINAEERHG